MPNDTAVCTDQRTAVVAEARTWLGTPFAHQRRQKGLGVDCIGVPAEVGKALGLPHCQDVPYAYTRQPNEREMQRELEARLDYVPFGSLRLADLLWLRAYAGGPAQHLAMVVSLSPLTILHASMRPTRTNPKRGEVIEHSIDEAWLKTRLRACFRYRGIDG